MRQTGLYSHRSKLEALNFGFKSKKDCTISVVKSKVQISCAVTAQLICAFVFTYACFWFSYVMAQLYIWAASWENQQSAYAKTKTQISFAVTAKLISAFVFATQIVHFLFFNLKFQASNLLLTVQPELCPACSQTTLLDFPWGGSYICNNFQQCPKILENSLLSSIRAAVWSSVLFLLKKRV